MKLPAALRGGCGEGTLPLRQPSLLRAPPVERLPALGAETCLSWSMLRTFVLMLPLEATGHRIPPCLCNASQS